MKGYNSYSRIHPQLCFLGSDIRRASVIAEGSKVLRRCNVHVL